MSESELEKAKSPTNGVLADVPVRNKKEKEDRVGEEVHSVDEDTVEKRPSRTVKLPARYADFCTGTAAEQSSDKVSSKKSRTLMPEHVELSEITFVFFCIPIPIV